MKNTKIILNGKTIFITESYKGKLSLEFFDLLSEFSNELIMNDDGGKFKKKLERFDISKDKTFGNDWHFEINDKSKPLLLEALRHYFQKQWGHFRFSLVGKSFRINYEEVGDDMVYPEYAKKGIYNLFEIKASGKSLNLIKGIVEMR